MTPYIILKCILVYTYYVYKYFFFVVLASSVECKVIMLTKERHTSEVWKLYTYMWLNKGFSIVIFPGVVMVELSVYGMG